MKLSSMGRFRWSLLACASILIGTALLIGLGSDSKHARPNVLLISIDSLRHDHLGIDGYHRDTSPYIDKLARSGAFFKNAISSSSWTLPAHVTLLTALPPQQHGVVAPADALDSDALSLAEVLQQNGYATAAFVSGPFLRSLHGFAQGFDLFDDEVSATNNLASHQDRTSPALFERVRTWLMDKASRDSAPFFLFLHMWDVHYDFDPPPPYDSLFDPDYTGEITGRNFELGRDIHPGMSKRDLEHVIALYDGEIRYTDSYVGKVLNVLEQIGASEKTIVIVTSDHGEEFFEHGQKGHGKNLYDETIRIPLIISQPSRIRPGQVIETQVRLADIAPTVLGLVGIPQPPEFGATQTMAVGLDLSAPILTDFAPPGDLIAHSHLRLFDKMTSVRNERSKFIRKGGLENFELYDLAEDPGENNDLARKSGMPAFGEALRAAERDQILTSRDKPPFRKSAATTKPHEARLRALGYID
ncbi:MAG TPA: hypothetical protein DCG06_01570 [Deltaproteobacteria bacterium]|nr:hypothetical protein [Deltaproteobacteria bacterium]